MYAVVEIECLSNTVSVAYGPYEDRQEAVKKGLERIKSYSIDSFEKLKFIIWGACYVDDGYKKISIIELVGEAK